MAKYRQGFVSNSSSSSFVIISAGGHFILEHGDTESDFDTDGTSVPIDELIGKLLQAREKGATTVSITHGGGYEG